MDQVRVGITNQGELQKKILILVGVVIGLMILFPPKVIVTKNPILDQSQTEYAGYHFIFDDPSAEKKQQARILLGDDVDKYIYSSTEWGKLFLQVALACGAAYGTIWFLKSKST